MRHLMKQKSNIPTTNNLFNVFDDFISNNIDATFRRLWNDAFADKNKIVDLFDNSVKYPKADARETSKGIEIDLAVPGCNKEDINITFNDGIITVQNKTITKEAHNTSKMLFNELRHSTWSRSWSVNGDVKEEEISASLKNGILTVSVPLIKPEIESKSTTRVISISDDTNENDNVRQENDVGK